MKMNSSGNDSQQNIEILKTGVNQYSILALSISLFLVVMTTVVVCYQDTGTVTLAGMAHAQSINFALRILDLMPFVFAVWGQYTGFLIARKAGALIVRETDKLRAETSEWKLKSLHESTHDALTGLPNREFFYKRLRDALLVASRNNESVTILLMNLDRFKEINDVFGVKSGDYILKQLSHNMANVIQSQDTLARIGGDEFAFLLNNLPAEATAIAVVRRIQRVLQAPVFIADENIELSASIGIVSYPDHGNDADMLMQCSSIAMYSAKKQQKGYMIFSPELSQENPRRVTLMGQLRSAIEEGALELHYQPKIDLLTDRLIGVEALVRLKHHDHGYISPAEFIPLAERTRLIGPLTDWVIHTAVQQSLEWTRKGLEIGMSVNVSAKDLIDTDLQDMLEGLVSSTDIDPARLTLEITESSIMADPKRAISVLKRLHAMQFNISIDDFGTGYSSLSYLSRLPVNEIKIDQTFVRGMSTNSNDESIVRATINLGHSLGLEVTAEGIENEQIMEMLKRMGCDIAQGNYISPSRPVASLEEWITDYSGNKIATTSGRAGI